MTKLEREPLGDALLSLTVVNALEIAASRREGRPLGTLDILLGILGIDVTWGWESVQVASSFVTAEDLDRFHDPQPEPSGSWHNVPLTTTASAALETAGRIATEYKLEPMPGGVLALRLLADPSSAASRAFLDDASIGHAELHDLIQEMVLDTGLQGLDLSRGGGSVVAHGPPDPEAGKRAGEPFARRALERASEIEGEEEPCSLALLLAAVELNQDPDLDELLDSMLLDRDHLAPLDEPTKELEDVAASTVVERARRRFGGDLDAAALIVTASIEASPRLARALGTRGLSTSEVAAQIAEWRARQAGDDRSTSAIAIASVVSVLGSIATSILLLASVSHSGDWWQLVLLLGIWSGYPQEGPVVGLFVAAVLFYLCGAGVALAQGLSVAAEVAQARVEREALWVRTGVKIPLREQRRVVARLLNARARLGQSLRQATRLHLRRLFAFR